MRKKTIFTIVLMVVMFSLCVTSTFAANGSEITAISGKVETLIYSVIETLKAIATPIGILALVFCGIKMLIASDPQSVRSAKTWMITIIIGLAIIWLAEPIVNAITSLSESTAG